MPSSFVRLIGLIALLSLTGCALHRTPPWPQATPPPSASSEAASSASRAQALFAQARAAMDTAGDAPSLDRCMALHEAVLREDPGHYGARVNLANLWILKGTAYTDGSSAKSQAFRRAMDHAELAMYTAPAFKALADQGRAPWEAAQALGAGQAEAMYFWVTALQYDFKEGMALPSKVVNLKWLKRALVFLDRIEAVAPDFGGGGVEVAQMICYHVLPASQGGDKAKAQACMEKAILKSLTGQPRLLARWARGKYYLPARGQKAAARADLEWVAAQDPAAYSDVYPWRVHFQADARGILR